jgi:hypothetical protein
MSVNRVLKDRTFSKTAAGRVLPGLSPYMLPNRYQNYRRPEMSRRRLRPWSDDAAEDTPKNRAHDVEKAFGTILDVEDRRQTIPMPRLRYRGEG